MTKKKKLLIGGGGALGVLLLAAIALASGGGGEVAVRVEEVGRHDLEATVVGDGTIEPQRSVDISADISGRVIELAVDEGQTVQRGDLLLRIDPTLYRAAVRRQQAAVAQARAGAAQANANLLQARSALARAERLAGDDNLISAADLEEARTGVAVAEAQYQSARYGVAQSEAALSEARDALGKTVITAPMGGRVTRLNIEAGETAIVGTMNNPGSLLLTVADLGVMEARVTVDETDVPRISFGDSAVVHIDAFRERTFTGRVSRVSNSAVQLEGVGASSEASVDFEVVVTLDDPPEGLRPDLSATAEIVTASRENALAVPILSLTVREPERAAGAEERNPNSNAEVEGVFVVRAGRAEFTPVEVGIAGDRHFEIRSGVEEGDTVVSGTYQAIRDLNDGDRVSAQADRPGGGG